MTTSQPSYNHQPPQPMYNRNLPFVRRLILAIVLLFLVLTGVSFVSWLILHPRVPAVRVDSLSVSNFNLSDLLTTAKYEVGFTVTNPNRKISLEFESFEVSVSYKRRPLSAGSVGRKFELRKMNETGLKIQLGNNCRVRGRTANEMGSDWNERREVSLNVRMVGLANFKASDWLSRHKTISVFCGDLEIVFGSDNFMTGKLGSTTATKDCSVYLL